MSTHEPTLPVAARRRRRLADLSVRTKILTAVGVLAVVLVASLGFALQSLRATSADTASVTDVANSLLRSNAEVDHLTQEAWRLTYQYPLVQGEARAQVVADMEATDALVDEQVAVIDGVLGSSGTVEPNWEEFKAGWAEWVAFRDATLMPAVDGGAVTPQIQTANDDIIASYRASLDASGAAVYEYLDTVADGASAQASRALLMMGVLAAGGLAVSLAVAFVVANNVRRSAEKVQRSLEAATTQVISCCKSELSAEQAGEVRRRNARWTRQICQR